MFTRPGIGEIWEIVVVLFINNSLKKILNVDHIIPKPCKKRFECT